jgi:hypothetical protein
MAFDVWCVDSGAIDDTKNGLSTEAVPTTFADGSYNGTTGILTKVGGFSGFSGTTGILYIAQGTPDAWTDGPYEVVTVASNDTLELSKDSDIPGVLDAPSSGTHTTLTCDEDDGPRKTINSIVDTAVAGIMNVANDTVVYCNGLNEAFTEKVNLPTMNANKYGYLWGYVIAPADGTAASIDAESTRQNCIDLNWAGPKNGWFIIDWILYGATQSAIDATNTSLNHVIGVTVRNNVSLGIAGSAYCYDCDATLNTTAGIQAARAVRCRMYANPGYGADVLDLQECRIYDNADGTKQVALRATGQIIRHCVIDANDKSDYCVSGAVITRYDIQNNIFVNAIDYALNKSVDGYRFPAAAGSLCDYNCENGATQGFGASFPLGSNNLAAGTDPLFVDEAGFDYRLTVGSPCIDTGSNGSSMGYEESLRGRTNRGPVDMGAQI